MKDSSISKEELDNITFLKEKSKALELQKQVADLILENTILKIYVKYKLSEDHYIEEQTGKIHIQVHDKNTKE